MDVKVKGKNKEKKAPKGCSPKKSREEGYEKGWIE
jgi:hypothetical protein